VSRLPVLPYGRQWIVDADVQAVADTLRGDWLTQGPAVARFEAALAEACGARHAVAVANGTLALHLACLAADVGPGSEGITSPITFLASANCFVTCGARPRFADIDPATWNLDPRAAEAAVNERTRALVPVDFAGLPADLEAFRAVADRHGLVVIEDACHALGATYHGRPVGGTGLAEMVCLSFHPVKHVTTGEGGAILTDDDTLARRLRRLRHHGITKDPAELTGNDGPWYYEMHEIGTNGRLTDFQCALGQAQLTRLPQFVARRRAVAAAYRQGFAGLAGVRLQADPGDRTNAHHLFVIHLDPAVHDRKAAFEALVAEGIVPQVHYVPVHLQPFYQRTFGTARGDFPHAEAYYAGCLSLPMFPALTDADVLRVVATVRAVLGAAA